MGVCRKTKVLSKRRNLYNDIIKQVPSLTYLKASDEANKEEVDFAL